MTKKKEIDLNEVIDLKFQQKNLEIDIENSKLEIDDLIKNKDKYIKEETEKILKNNKEYQKTGKRLKELLKEAMKFDHKEELK